MDWLPALVEKVSSLYGVVILLIVMIVGYILLRTGKLQIKTKSVQLGKADIEENERKIMRQQMSFLHVSAEGMCSQLPSDLDMWRTKYVIAKVCDVLEEAILYNHIERGDEAGLTGAGAGHHAQLLQVAGQGQGNTAADAA